MRALAFIGLLVVAIGCGGSSKPRTEDAGATSADFSGDPACPAGYMDDDPPISCNVLGQHCSGYENGAYCVGCTPGHYWWETDEIGIECDGGTPDGG